MPPRVLELTLSARPPALGAPYKELININSKQEALCIKWGFVYTVPGTIRSELVQFACECANRILFASFAHSHRAHP